jgi:hypothetical protein
MRFLLFGSRLRSHLNYFQILQGRPHFLINRALLVILLYPGPHNSSIFINDVNRRVWNTFKLLPVIRGIANSKRVDETMAGVGQNRVVDTSLTVSRDLVSKLFALGGSVNTNRVDVQLLAGLYEIP